MDTNTDDVKIDEEGVEDAEIIDDEEDLEQIKMIKARFELKKMKSNLSTPAGSVHGSKMKNPEDSDASVPNSKQKTNLDLEKDDLYSLKERLLCISCTVMPRCMLITTCKHVLFCQECDTKYKL